VYVTLVCAYVNLLRDFFSLWIVVVQWLRCCATNRKVAGSIPDGINDIFFIRSQCDPGVDSASLTQQNH